MAVSCPRPEEIEDKFLDNPNMELLNHVLFECPSCRAKAEGIRDLRKRIRDAAPEWKPRSGNDPV